MQIEQNYIFLHINKLKSIKCQKVHFLTVLYTKSTQNNKVDVNCKAINTHNRMLHINYFNIFAGVKIILMRVLRFTINYIL